MFSSCLRLLSGTAISAALTLSTAQAEPLNFAPPSAPLPLFQEIMPSAHPAAAPAAQPIALHRQAPEEPEAVSVPEHLRRQIVAYRTTEARGTVVVDTANRRLYYVLGDGQAVRYGIGVGREGFTWSGVRSVGAKAEWPDWTPPAQMLARQPYLPRWVAGGPGNPLGARALYLAGSLYRIHGTNTPASIGQNVSSGCIRMLNEDVIDLYRRVEIGTKVVVLPDGARSQRVVSR
jgi:lipoprotein-anchoring transpeptidase ErfK/SrfK